MLFSFLQEIVDSSTTSHRPDSCGSFDMDDGMI